MKVPASGASIRTIVEVQGWGEFDPGKYCSVAICWSSDLCSLELSVYGNGMDCSQQRMNGN